MGSIISKISQGVSKVLSRLLRKRGSREPSFPKPPVFRKGRDGSTYWHENRDFVQAMAAEHGGTWELKTPSGLITNNILEYARDYPFIGYNWRLSSKYPYGLYDPCQRENDSRNPELRPQWVSVFGYPQYD